MSHPDSSDFRDEHEALIQFLNSVPVGLVEAALDGTIGMINAISAQLLMPLSRDGTLANLFTALENVVPSLRPLCADFSPPRGIICDAMYIHLNSNSKSASTVVSLTLVKLDQSRLMAVLSDVTLQVRRERESGKAMPGLTPASLITRWSAWIGWAGSPPGMRVLAE